jgi:hypothetical protein
LSAVRRDPCVAVKARAKGALCEIEAIALVGEA